MKKAGLCFGAVEPGACRSAVTDTDVVCDRPAAAELRVGVQAGVRLAVAGSSGTDLVVSAVLAATSCDNLLCVPARPSGISRLCISSDVSFVQWASAVSF